MSVEKEDLSKFRKEIDEIDEKVIALFKDRLKIVEQVGKHKSKNSATKSFIRSGREAEMIKNLARKADNKFPAAAIATIWRMIISTSLNSEQGIKLIAYTDHNKNDCYWHAREYYGTFVDTTCCDSKELVIESVASGKANVGVLPLYDNSDNPWWNRPSSEINDIYIFARIPFIETKDDKSNPSIAIASVMPEQTDEDVSVIVTNTSKSEIEVVEALEQFSLDARIISKHQDSYLVEVDSFVGISDNKIQQIKEKLNDESLRLLGSYAKPIQVNI
jgi:chorismate mutase